MLEFLGIGLGTLEIQLDRFSFVPGEKITGRLSFKLKEPTAARGVVVGVRARQRVIERNRSSQGTSTSYRNDVVWKFERNLAGEDVYTDGSFPFELVIASDVFHDRVDPPPGTLGDIARVVSFLSPSKRMPLEWEVYGHVDLPWKVNVSKKVSIVVTERTPA